jgi:hypothetical protein
MEMLATSRRLTLAAIAAACSKEIFRVALPATVADLYFSPLLMPYLEEGFLLSAAYLASCHDRLEFRHNFHSYQAISIYKIILTIKVDGAEWEYINYTISKIKSWCPFCTKSIDFLGRHFLKSKHALCAHKIQKTKVESIISKYIDMQVIANSNGPQLAAGFRYAKNPIILIDLADNERMSGASNL